MNFSGVIERAAAPFSATLIQYDVGSEQLRPVFAIFWP